MVLREKTKDKILDRDLASVAGNTTNTDTLRTMDLRYLHAILNRSSARAEILTIYVSAHLREEFIDGVIKSGIDLSHLQQV